MKDLEIDICLIQESWLQSCDDAKLAEIDQLGYKIISVPRKRVGGGVAVLYNSGLKIKLKKSPKKYKTFEKMEVVLQCEDNLIRFVNIYRPTYSKKHPYTITDFLPEFEECLESYVTKPGETIFTGDFNVHIENSCNPHVVSFYDMLESFSMNIVVPLCPTHRDGGTLDLIIIPEELQSTMKNVEIEELGSFSDHFAVTCELDTSVKLTSDEKMLLTYRRFKDIDINRFKEDIKLSALNNLSGFSSSNDACKCYKEILSKLINDHCPQIQKNVQQKHKPWFDEDVRKNRRLRRKMERTWKKNKSMSNKSNYNQFSKTVSRMIRTKRKTHYHNLISNANKNSKKFYATVNPLLGRSSRVLPTSHNDRKLADSFKDFFTQKVNNIHDEIDKSSVDNGQCDFNKTADSEINCKFEHFDPVTYDKLHEIVRSLPDKFCILDPIPTWILKECFDELSTILLYIVNSSLSSGEFPDDLKSAIVLPVVKDFKGDCDNMKNYRPVSNLSVVSKILEKAVHFQLHKYLFENDLYCDIQSGYRMGHSCETLLVKMSDDIINEIDHKNLVAVVLLDLSAAFDVIDHNLLINKLKIQYGIGKNALKWFQSYLKNRSFSVKINKETSTVEIVLYGVPQGSILGPLLFIMYTKELASIVADFGLNLQLYADDSQVYIEFNPRNPQEITETLKNISNCLTKIKSWMVKNYLKINEDKTEFFIVGHRNTLKDHPLQLEVDFCGTTVRSKLLNGPGVTTDDGKSLGVLFSNDFSMARQICDVKKNCYNSLRNLRNIKEYLSAENKLGLVQSLILSKMDFSNSLYMNIPKYQLNELGKVLNSCMRFIYNIKRTDNVSEYYLKSHILPIEYRVKFKVLLLIHKCLYGNAPMYLNNLVSLHCHKMIASHRNLRSKQDFSLLSVNHDARTSHFALRRFTNYAPITWNSIPNNIRNCMDINNFKKMLKTYFFNVYEQSI